MIREAAAVMDAELVVVALMGARNLHLPEVAVMGLVQIDLAHASTAVQEQLDARGCGRKGPEDDARGREMRPQEVLCLEFRAHIEAV